MTNECELCKKIWSSQEEYCKQFAHHHYDETYALVMEDGKPYLYVPCEDWYYSDVVMQVNYCPKCGRKLI